jgi:membrane protein required for colicin V production
MSLVDILILAVLLIFVIKGFMKGLVREVCSLLGLVAGGWASFRYYHYVAEAIRPFVHLPQHIARVISFILLFLIIGLLFYLFGHLLTAIFRIMLLGSVNRIGGLLFGLLEGAAVLCIVLYFGTTSPAPRKVQDAVTRSKAARPFVYSGREMISGWDSATRRVGTVR